MIVASLEGTQVEWEPSSRPSHVCRKGGLVYGVCMCVYFRGLRVRAYARVLYCVLVCCVVLWYVSLCCDSRCVRTTIILIVGSDLDLYRITCALAPLDSFKLLFRCRYDLQEWNCFCTLQRLGLGAYPSGMATTAPTRVLPSAGCVWL